MIHVSTTLSLFTVGFTGTQHGMDRSQLESLESWLRDCFLWCKRSGRYPVFRHGDCIGADDQAARTAAWLGFYVVSHPCTIESKRAYSAANEILKQLPPLDRNRVIVSLSDWMVATPKEDQETLRSGTWATIRYVRKAKKPVHIIYP